MITSTYPVYPVKVNAQLATKLSRGLWLVKWLQAIPHYVVLAFLCGLYVVSEVATTDQAPIGVWRSGLVGLLVLFAAVVLLFTGRYPQSMYDFVLGINRWALRVAGYAGLMTDQYPPFRLDQGGQEPEGGQPIMFSTPQQLSHEPPQSVIAPDQAPVPALS